MGNKTQNEKDNNKSLGENLGSLANLIKNAKFLLLTILTLVVLGVAVFSGDGKNIALDFYENVTGRKFQTFSPVQNYSSETYIILKDTLSRKTSINIENKDISVFEKSDTFHRYRVTLRDEVFYYKIQKNSAGIWQIDKEE